MSWRGDSSVKGDGESFMYKNEKKREQLVSELQERLCWCVNEAEDSDANNEEIEAINRLLDALDPVEYDREYYSADKSWERFREKCASRTAETALSTDSAAEASAETPDNGAELQQMLEDEQFRRALAEMVLEEKRGKDKDKPGDKTKDRTKDRTGDKAKSKIIGSTKVLSFSRRQKGIVGTVTAAVLAVVFFMGGAIGAYAEKENGFFMWRKDDESGLQTIIIPHGEAMGAGVVNAKKYGSLEDVPEVYRAFVWSPEKIPEKYELSYYEVMKGDEYVQILSKYRQEQFDLYLEIECKIFEENILFYTQTYDEYSYAQEEKPDEIHSYQKENEECTEYIAWFDVENCQYVVQGNDEMNLVFNMALEYLDDVKENR